MWQYNHTDELYHHGVKGMRWGQRRQKRVIEKEKRALVKDAKRIEGKYKARPGEHTSVMGNYKRSDGLFSARKYVAHHILDDKGKVKMSYLKGEYGDIYLASGKDYVSKMKLDDFFNRPPSSKKIEYDVYE